MDGYSPPETVVSSPLSTTAVCSARAPVAVAAPKPQKETGVQSLRLRHKHSDLY